MNTVVEITDRPAEAENCIILDISAENFTYPQTTVLKSHIGGLISQGYRLFVLNLSEVRLVDSYGLATIIAVLKIVKENGGALALYGLNDMFTHLVEITHLDRVLEIWTSESQATYYLSTQSKS